jgi:HemY protein
MIKLFIFSLLAIVLALALNLATGFPADPGYLMVAFGNTTFETSLFALLVAIGIIFLLLRLLLFLFYAFNPFRLVSFGKNFSANRKSRQRNKSVEGLLAFARGDWQLAYGLLIRGAKQADSNVANFLAAAYAAHELEDRDAWTKALTDAESEYPTSRLTIQFVKAQLLFKSNQLEQCLAILEQIKNSGSKESGVFRLLKEVYINLQEWQKLDELVPVLEKRKIIDAVDAETIRKRVFVKHLDGVIEHSGSESGVDGSVDSTQLDLLSKMWKKSPAKYREDEKIVKHYIELLVKLGAKIDAAKVLETALSKNWSNSLIIKFAEMDYDSNQAQLLVAENWLKARPANSPLLLSLGRICMRNKLWGKAREYYQASIRISPSAEAYGELARLLKNLGDDTQSEDCFHRYRDLIGSSLLELPLPELPLGDIS